MAKCKEIRDHVVVREFWNEELGLNDHKYTHFLQGEKSQKRSAEQLTTYIDQVLAEEKDILKVFIVSDGGGADYICKEFQQEMLLLQTHLLENSDAKLVHLVGPEYHMGGPPDGAKSQANKKVQNFAANHRVIITEKLVEEQIQATKKHNAILIDESSSNRDPSEASIPIEKMTGIRQYRHFEYDIEHSAVRAWKFSKTALAGLPADETYNGYHRRNLEVGSASVTPLTSALHWNWSNQVCPF